MNSGGQETEEQKAARKRASATQRKRKQRSRAKELNPKQPRRKGENILIRKYDAGAVKLDPSSSSIINPADWRSRKSLKIIGGAFSEDHIDYFEAATDPNGACWAQAVIRACMVPDKAAVTRPFSRKANLEWVRFADIQSLMEGGLKVLLGQE